MRRIVLITGGSRGIGKACAQAFAESGDLVVIFFKSDHSSAQKTLESLKGDGHQSFQCDFEDVNQIQNSFGEIERLFGRVDVLVNSAGVAIEHKVGLDFTKWMEIWNQTIHINLTGMAASCYLAGQLMMKAKKGVIINISSRGAFRGEPEMPAYGASKAGVNGLSQSLAKAFGAYGISVSAIAPGFVETDMAKPFLDGSKGEALRKESPFGRVAQPGEIARLAVFLADSDSKFLAGGIIDVNGASYLRM